MRNDETEQEEIWRTSQLEAANKELSSEIEIRKKTEEKLLKERDNFLKIFSAVPMGILLLDCDKSIVHANQAIYSTNLRNPTEVIGRLVGGGLGCIHSLETNKGCGFSDSCPACPLRQGIEQVVKEKKQIHGAEMNLNLLINGKFEDRCLSVSAEPIDIEGHLHVIVAIDDITDRKKTEEALIESEKRLSTILETEPECVKILNLEGKLEYMNPAGLNMIGADNLDEVLGQSVLPLVNEEYRKPFTELFVETLGGGGGKLEFKVTGLKGKSIWLETNSVPLRLKNEEITGVLGITRDITDRKKTEKKLKKSLSLVTATLESTVDGILVVDKKRRVRRFNKRFVELWRISDSVLSTREDEKLLASVLEQLSDPDSFLTKVEDLYLTNDESFDVVDFKDGRIFEFYSRPQELDGKNIGRVWSFRDVTKRKKAEEALKESKSKLEELNATKDKLFSVIAHDLRSPFNSIIGFSDLLIENIQDFGEEERKEFLRIINSSAKNTLSLLDNLLNWAKTQTGKIIFKPEKITLSTIIQEIIEISNSIANLKNIQLNHIQADEIEIYTDENIVKTVLRNLISNAIKFTEIGGSVNVSVIAKQDHIEITVSDNGVGMNDETRKMLFDMSTNMTSTGTENETGSGLGLVLCKEFMDKLGGNIWVESELGKGSDFKFTIPFKAH